MKIISIIFSDKEIEYLQVAVSNLQNDIINIPSRDPERQREIDLLEKILNKFHNLKFIEED